MAITELKKDDVIEIAFAAADTGASGWVYWLEQEGPNLGRPRCITGKLVAGDTIVVEVSNDDNPTTAEQTFFALASYTAANFGGLIEGDWKWVRLRKSGITGAAVAKISR